MKLIDTCSIINLFENNKEDVLLDKDIAVCSFNKDELTKITHRHSINEHLRHRIRKFFEKNSINIVYIPVTPGNELEEKVFVESIDNELLKLIPDPSDAVLAACAARHKADIVTRDRHHLYTAKLENFFNRQGIKVFKKPL